MVKRIIKRPLIDNLLAAAIVASAAFAANAQVIAGGYSTISNTDTRAVKAAQFAAAKYGVKLGAVERAESQVVAGTNFRLCLAVTAGGVSSHAKTVVYEDLRPVMSVTSWESAAGCGDDTSESQTAPNCKGSQLSLAEGDAESDMGGKRYGRFVFTNISSTPCSLMGFPRLTLLTRSGAVIKGVVYTNDFPGMSDMKAPVRTILEPTHIAIFDIYWNDGMALPRKKYAKAARVKVSAPGDKMVFVLKSDIQPCCGVQVSPIHAEIENHMN